MDATESRLSQPATVYINVAALKSRLDEHNVRVCYLPMLRQFITGRDYPDGERLTIPRMVLIVREGCGAEYRGFLLDRPNTQTEYRVLSVPNPDGFIRSELGDLEASTAVAMFDHMPSTEFFERLRAIELRLVLLCKRAPANLESLLERGVFGVVALSKFTRTTFQPNPELPAARDLIIQEVIQLIGPAAGTTQRPADPAADADAVGHKFHEPPAAEPVITGSGEIVAPLDAIQEDDEELPGPTELVELAREQPPAGGSASNGEMRIVPGPTTPKTETKTAIIVVDDASLYFSVQRGLARPGYKAKIDHLRLIDIISRGWNVTGQYYVGRSPQTDQSQHFFRRLSKRGFIHILPDEALKPGDQWDDIQIVENLPVWARDADTVILVSGDGAYYETLQSLRALGKHVVVVGVGNQTNASLKRFDSFIDLADHQEEIIRLEVGRPTPAMATQRLRFTLEADLSFEQVSIVQKMLAGLLNQTDWAETNITPVTRLVITSRLPKSNGS